MLSACAGLPARGNVGMQTIETRVDSEAARYYVEYYLAAKGTDEALDDQEPIVACPIAESAND